jgi:hypothetical protein
LDDKTKAQLSGTIVNQFNHSRITDEINKVIAQDQAFQNAHAQINKVQEFVGKPNNIFGSSLSKHGEIAEHVEVGIHNARQALDGQNMTATFDGVGRTAPEDYLVNGISVQSKFIKGINNNLSHVIDQMDKKDYFGRDGSYYHIPKDTHATIQKVMNGEPVDGLAQKTINKIKEKVRIIEANAGKPFAEVVLPANSEYAEVQLETVNRTLDKHKDELNKKNSEKIDKIHQNHKPSFQEGLKATGVAAAVGVAVSLTTGLYKKYKEGKRFYKGDFTVEDWKEIGVNTLKGGVIGGVSGAAIYGLTNYAALSAPFAGAIVSATNGVTSLIKDYHSGKINGEDFVELGMVICAESAIVGIATAVGQTTIPIPVLGAVLGSVAGSMFLKILGGKERKTANKIHRKIDEYIQKLDEVTQYLIKKINTEFDKLGELTKAAFSFENNEKLLQYSIDLARAYGVDEHKIIKSHEELDNFILG